MLKHKVLLIQQQKNSLPKVHPSEPEEGKVEIKIPDDGITVKELGKTVSQIQTGVAIAEDTLTGTSLYLNDVVGLDGNGNYLVIELPQAKVPENTVKCKFAGGEEITLSITDDLYLIKVTEGGKKPITVTVSGNVNATRTIDISGLNLQGATPIRTKKKIEAK